MAYSFTIPVRHGVTISMTGLTDDLDLFLLRGTGGSCSASSCLTKSILTGTAAESIDMTLDAGTYYIVADGYSDAISSFTLSLSCRMPEICSNGSDDDGDALIDCMDPDCSTFPTCAPRCIPAATVSCGTVISGSTTATGYTDVIEDYSCSAWPETGNEFAYTFLGTGISTGATFTIDTLSTTYLDLYLIGSADSTTGCSPTACIEASETNDATDSISVTFTPGTTYYVVVDGYADYTGTYRLSVTCP